MHCNQCINLGPEKCKLGKIPICCQYMCSEELKFSPISSSTRYLESWNSNFSQKSQIFGNIYFSKIQNLSLYGLETLKRSIWKRIDNIFREKFKNKASMSKTQDMNVVMIKKKGRVTHFSWLYEAWYMIEKSIQKYTTVWKSS